jgi:hypothetical protein
VIERLQKYQPTLPALTAILAVVSFPATIYLHYTHCCWVIFNIPQALAMQPVSFALSQLQDKRVHAQNF